MLALAAMAAASGVAQERSAGAAVDARAAARRANLPPQVVQAERFLARRGWTKDGTAARARAARPAAARFQAHSEAQASGSATWTPLGPTAVISQNFGLVTGRITALALDPSDATGNTLYVGTTGGGVWKSQNADTSNSSNIAFTPLTDNLPALSGVQDASISIGALAVQPGGTGVILAGTGDPNDALDSYYGAGILRSADNGTTWSLISATADNLYSFIGEGFAGFAWSTVNTDLVVAAVSQAYEGALVNAVWPNASYEGLYYSADGGATWSLATITDGSNEDVQGPDDTFALPDGNAATAVVWNPVRKLFVAAVRYHGYYQSADGITWTRLAAQPGANLLASAGYCPTNPGGTGSTACPIFRGALAVNSTTGDTFAWTVDEYNQDQGLWQDLCEASAGACTNSTITFAQQWATTALETDTLLGGATIENGDYNLALAAVPSGQTTIVLAGANDLWKTGCPYSQGCRWRNATNSTVGFCAAVGEYQHALAWNASNPLEIFVGNDSGLWRSMDAINESGTVCASSDASHFQNLNGSLGSLAEVVGISQAGATPYTMMAGLADGIAGVASTTAATTDWPEILGGSGPVAIDPDNASNWYVNNAPGVSIYLGTPTSGNTPGTFNAVLNYTTDPSAFTTSGADVVRDGLYMAEEPPYAPAAFLVDPLDSSQLLIATCRVWRGPATGTGWSASNAVSPILDGVTGDNDCSGNALIRSLAAMKLPVSTLLPSGGEVVYVGMYGEADGGGTLAGHVLSATYNEATASWSAWTDVTALNPVSNDTRTMNYYGLGISSIFIDPLDVTGQTVYVTVAGISGTTEKVQTVYGSTNGGVNWTSLMYNLPASPANSVAVDPASSSTVYVATDEGVYATQALGSCAAQSAGCWASFGSGLPQAPVVALSAQPASASAHNLIAATYGRGIWMTPLLGAGAAGSGAATGTLSVTALNFPSTAVGEISTAEYVTLTNSGGVELTSIAVSASGAFTAASPCTAVLPANSSCTISVQFAPVTEGAASGTLTISDSAADSPQTVTLSGTGLAPPAFGVSPSTLSFSVQTVGQSTSQTLTVANTGGAPLSNVGFQITGSSSISTATGFSTGTTTCGATLGYVSGQNSCTVVVTFAPAAAGGSTASLVVSSSTSGVAAVAVPLTGVVTAAALNAAPAQLLFPVVLPGLSSPQQSVTITNNGGSAAAALTLTATSPFSLTQNGCPGSLAAGASCTTGVIFSPSLDGSYTGTLTIASSSVAAPAIVPLSGTGGTPGSIQALPNSVSFTSQSGSSETGVGLRSAPVTVTLTNPDSVNSLTGFSVAVTTGFKLVSTTCASTLAAGASCAAVVEFAPVSPGAQSGSLVVTSSALPTGSFVPLSGMGFDFTITPSGSSSQTISNGQTADYKLVIAPLLGSEGAFTFQCSSLPPDSTCTFNPASQGIRANQTGYEVVEIATGVSQATAHSSPRSPWPALPLACGLALAPFALARRRKAWLLAVLLAILAGGVSSCTSSSVISTGTVPGSGSTGSTSVGTYTVTVTATSNGVQHQATLTLIVD